MHSTQYPPAGPAASRLPPLVWVHVGVAAAAMVLTLPGRTHGLGLVTEPLTADLSLGKVPFAVVNFWATLIGAVFCVPIGWMIDRLGVRLVLGAVLLALGSVVLAMTGVTTGGRLIELPVLIPEAPFDRGVEFAAVPLDLFLLVLLTRGFGQSALSVVSLALIGKVAGKKPGAVIGVYSFLVAIGFTGAYFGVKEAFEVLHVDWRALWGGLGWVLVASGALALVFVREPKPAEAQSADEHEGAREHSYTLGAALLTPAFWVFGLAVSFYGMVSAGTSLFNQSLLAERGFNRSVFFTITTVGPLIGLVGNLGAGWLATKIRLGVLLAASLVIQAVALACFPLISTLTGLSAYVIAMSIAGGILMVTFFAVWRPAYGPKHLGKIQGAAQLLTVFASAAGPLVLAVGHRTHNSYGPVIQYLAIAAAVFAVAAWFVPVPSSSEPVRRENAT